MSLEAQMVRAVEPLIEDIIKLERADEKLEQTLAGLTERLDVVIASAKMFASDEAKATIDAMVAPLKQDLRDTFANAITEVKQITEEAIATANRQASIVSFHIESREKTAAAILLTEAQRYGA
jgi:hypothetical protein